MHVRKLLIGAAVAATALLSACSSQAKPIGQEVALAGNTPPGAVSTTATTTGPATTASTPTATAKPTTTTSKSTTTSRTTTTSKTTPKTTTSKTTPAQSAEAPCSTKASACVKLSTNQSWLMEDGKVVYGPVPITSGKPGYLTPPGSFRVGWKDIDHKSSEFNNAPMNFSVFFNGGIAFHEGSLRDKSHGCIHLSRAAAQKFYNGLQVGDTVEVVR